MITTTAEAAVRALLQEHAAAMRAMDADRVAACYLPGAVVYNLAPPLGRVFDAEEQRAWFASKGAGPMDYELRDVEVAVGADVAVAYGLAKMGGAGFALWFRITAALREVDGRWRIAHVHESTPFYMDGSLRAAVDLTP